MTTNCPASKILFIANRGEVCRRIALTAKRLNWQTATIFQDDQLPDYLVGLIDIALKADPSIEKPYLSIDAMLRYAREANATAIHPGFGFLSENDEFASRCINAGFTWVGPRPEAIKAMASKASSRDIAAASNVPINQALQNVELVDTEADIAKIKNFATQVGYPILIKAAYGGGGKGMRVVHDPEQLRESVLRCHSEGKSSFGNGQLLIEKYIAAPRHIEVQILGDQHGTVLAFGDRDCSIQRRHQKVIEEAPAPFLNQETRRALHQAAINLGQKVGYDSAGTVEFLLDSSVDYRQPGIQPFFFLEMNTRLQVEHPVTEEVFGVDLVEWQVKVAIGDKLPAEFAKLEPRGHSVEMRLYAEDCSQDFMPSPGTVHCFDPHYELGIRWALGLGRSGVISANFDPMIAKCIATGPDRDAALDRLSTALQKSVLFGPKNNISFVRNIINTADFRSGKLSTHFIKDRLASLRAAEETSQEELKGLLAELTNLNLTNVTGSKNSPSVSDITTAAFNCQQQYPSVNTELNYRPLAPALNFLSQTGDDVQLIRLVTTKAPYRLVDYARVKSTTAIEHWLGLDGATVNDRIDLNSLDAYQHGGIDGHSVNAPVPGKVIAVRAQAGDNVLKGQVLLVLESMKMEFEIKSDRDATIESVAADIGQQVTAGQALAVWKT